MVAATLGDDRWVVAHDWTGDGGHEADLARRICNRSQHGPGQGGMPLLLDPREKVIRDGRELETSVLGAPGILDEVCRAVFLRHELVAELNHG